MRIQYIASMIDKQLDGGNKPISNEKEIMLQLEMKSHQIHDDKHV